MGKSLTANQIAQYRRDGFLCPLPAIPRDAASILLADLETLERREGGTLSERTNKKPHLLLPWLGALIRDARILDAVEDVIGTDILCWGSGFFAKGPSDGKRVSWHQDSTYWGLSKPDVVTAWIALTPSTVESGCMRVVPGTHLLHQVSHRDTFASENLLSRGQEIEAEVDEREAVDLLLQPGEMSLHHVRLIHGSAPNRAPHRRVGYAIRYTPTHIRQAAGNGDSATLVRGEDRYGHFTPEPAPRAAFDPDAVRFHARMLDNTARILYRGTEHRPDYTPASSRRPASANQAEAASGNQMRKSDAILVASEHVPVKIDPISMGPAGRFSRDPDRNIQTSNLSIVIG